MKLVARKTAAFALLLAMAATACMVPSFALAASETWKVTVKEGLSVRSGANSSSSRVGALAYGSVVTISSTSSSGGYTWGKISSVSAAGGSWFNPGYSSYNGYYVALNYCTKAAPVVQSPFPAYATISRHSYSPASVSVSVTTSIPVDAVRSTAVLYGRVYNGPGKLLLTKSNGGKYWSLNNVPLAANALYKIYFVIDVGGKSYRCNYISFDYNRGAVSGNLTSFD